MLKEQIKDAITGFKKSATQNAALNLFRLLGYHSDRRVDTSSVPEFLETFDQNKQLNQKKALVSEWTNVKCLFQITDEEIKETQQGSLFEEETAYENQIIESYLFLSIDLKQDQYTRTALAQVTRAVNSLFAMPALILFRHNHHFTLSVINRRLHKKDRTRDVLEKVTLVKDVSIESPHRAHIEILHDLALPNCSNAIIVIISSPFIMPGRRPWTTLNSTNASFKVANWYFWAVDTVVFPMPSSVNDAEAYKAQSVIRLITRLIFCWFIKEKGLLYPMPFSIPLSPGIVKERDARERQECRKKIPVRGDESGYYKAILQNLFCHAQPGNGQSGISQRRPELHGAHALSLQNITQGSEAFLALLNDVPFLNGGLFECLDKTEGTKEKPTYVRVDGFSDRTDNPLYVPDALFFGEEHAYDLNSAYGSKNKKYTVRGIIHTLNRYKFTIEENTPIEEEIALDPELLGRVFENLLAAYNPETGATARKQTGSFYTPREIVHYMVDEALVARLTDMLQESFPKAKHLEEKLRHLFSYNQEPHKFTEEETRTLIAAIDSLKILDPACGSGAFPMGVIHKLVFILSKLDPENKHWLQRQIERVNDLPDPTIRDVLIKDIERAFRKMPGLRSQTAIENCVFGVDIQPVAVQIAS